MSVETFVVLYEAGVMFEGGDVFWLPQRGTAAEALADGIEEMIRAHGVCVFLSRTVYEQDGRVVEVQDVDGHGLWGAWARPKVKPEVVSVGCIEAGLWVEAYDAAALASEGVSA